MKYKVAIVIPALNEDATLGGVIGKCFEALPAEKYRPRIVVVDDGSTDTTANTAREAGAVVVSHSHNRGVGQAFQSGLRKALQTPCDIVVNIDADGQFDPARIPELIQPIIAGEADVTTASRFKDPSLVPDMPRAKLWGNRMMSRLISRMSGTPFCDVSCGFRAYSRDAALRLNLWGEFTYTQESILDLIVKGMRVVEVPMRIQGVRSVGESRVASNLWKYAQRSARIILHTYRDYWPLQFFGWLSLPCLVPGGALVLFLLGHRVVNGRFSPHIWAGFIGGALLALGFMVLITGVMSEMLKRIRLNQEMMLYYHRRAEYGRSDAAREDAAADHDGAVRD